MAPGRPAGPGWKGGCWAAAGPPVDSLLEVELAPSRTKVVVRVVSVKAVVAGKGRLVLGRVLLGEDVETDARKGDLQKVHLCAAGCDLSGGSRWHARRCRVLTLGLLAAPRMWCARRIRRREERYRGVAVADDQVSNGSSKTQVYAPSGAEAAAAEVTAAEATRKKRAEPGMFNDAWTASLKAPAKGPDGGPLAKDKPDVVIDGPADDPARPRASAHDDAGLAMGTMIAEAIAKAIGAPRRRRRRGDDDDAMTSDEDDEASPERKRGSSDLGLTTRRSPGLLAKQALLSMASAQGMAAVNAPEPGQARKVRELTFVGTGRSTHMKPCVTAFVRSHLGSGGLGSNVRSKREAETLAAIIDFLVLGELGRAADVGVQRLKAIELASRDGDWTRATEVELLATADCALVSRDEQCSAARRARWTAKAKPVAAKAAAQPSKPSGPAPPGPYRGEFCSDWHPRRTLSLTDHWQHEIACLMREQWHKQPD